MAFDPEKVIFSMFSISFFVYFEDRDPECRGLLDLILGLRPDGAVVEGAGRKQ